MNSIMSDSVLLQNYHLFPPELKIAISSYVELLSQNYNAAIEPTVSKTKKIRKFGIMKGGIKYMAPDFDASLDDFKDYM